MACGEGTRLEEGLCVVAPLASCPEGQARVDGACRSLCGSNTSDSAQGCVVAAGACGAGTVLSAGRCVLSDPMSGVTVREGAEPNDRLAQATVVDLGTGTAVLGGNIGAPGERGERGGDFDLYRFEVPAGKRLTVTLESSGGPLMAARLFPADRRDANRWSSYLFGAGGRRAERGFELPFGGTWALEISASDNFPGRGGLPVGGPEFLYRAQLALSTSSAPVPLERPGEGFSAPGRFDAPSVYRLEGNPGAAPFVYTLVLERPEVEAPLEGLRRLAVLTPDGRTLALSLDSLNDGRISLMNAVRVLVPAEGALVRVDYVYANRPDRGFHLRAFREAVDLPAVPGTGLPGSLADDNQQVFAFDAPADTVLRVLVRKPADSSLSTSIRCELRDAAGEQRDVVTAFGSVLDAFAGREGGRFWVVCEDQRFDPAGASPHIALDMELLPVVRTFAAIAAEEHLLERHVLPPLAPNATTARLYAAFHLDAPMLVKAAAQSVTGESRIGVRLLGASLEELVPQGPAATAVSTQAPVLMQPGDYFIEVASTQGSSSTAGGEVDVALDAFTAQCIGEAEPNDATSLSQELSVSASDVACVDAAWQSDERHDFFRFKATAGSRVRVMMMNRGAPTVQKLSVFLRALGSATNLAEKSVVGSAMVSMTASLSANTDYELGITFSSELFGARSMPGDYSVGFTLLP